MLSGQVMSHRLIILRKCEDIISYFRFEAGIPFSSDKKSILGEILLHPMDRKGNGTNVKKLIKLAMEMAVESSKNHQLVKLGCILFLIVVFLFCLHSFSPTIPAKIDGAFRRFPHIFSPDPLLSPIQC